MEWHEWFVSLPPDFLFMMLLPFAVAFAGLAQESARPPQDEGRRQQRRPGALHLSGDMPK